MELFLAKFDSEELKDSRVFVNQLGAEQWLLKMVLKYLIKQGDNRFETAEQLLWNEPGNFVWEYSATINQLWYDGEYSRFDATWERVEGAPIKTYTTSLKLTNITKVFLCKKDAIAHIEMCVDEAYKDLEGLPAWEGTDYTLNGDVLGHIEEGTIY